MPEQRQTRWPRILLRARAFVARSQHALLVAFSSCQPGMSFEANELLLTRAAGRPCRETSSRTERAWMEAILR